MWLCQREGEGTHTAGLQQEVLKHSEVSTLELQAVKCNLIITVTQTGGVGGQALRKEKVEGRVNCFTPKPVCIITMRPDTAKFPLQDTCSNLNSSVR